MLPLNHVLQNRYRILRPLGKGGMGHVYEAMDDAVDCIVAIKETFADTDRLRRAFEREAKLLANLRHPILPRVTHHFLEGGMQFLVMDYVEGLNLLELLALRKQAFPCAEVVSWADKLLGALEYLHSRPEPVIHRDIKPANIKLTKDGEIYLLDFGLAKGSAGQMSTMDPDQSAFASVYGYTAAYAPLEQLTNSGTNAQSDLYSLGATLYHLLTGQAPVSANVRYEALEMDATDPLPTTHQLSAQVTEAVSDVISHAMAMSRRERLRSASEMRAAFREGSYKTSESVETRLKQTQSDSAPASVADEQQPARAGVGATGLSPTIASPPVVVPLKPAPQPEQRTIKAPPPVVSSPPGESLPSAEVSWPSQINTSDAQAAPPSEEQRPPAMEAGQANRAASGTLPGRGDVPLSTIVAGKPSAPDLVWQQQPASLTARLLGPEKRKGSNAKIVIVCGIFVALVAIAILGIYLSSAWQTANTNAPTTQTGGPVSNTTTTSTPASYSFQKDLQSGQGVVWAVAWSPGGTYVATAGDDQRVRFYEGPSLILNDSEWSHPSVINSIATSPTGKAIASASNDKTVTFRTGGVNTILKGHTDEVYFVAFSPDGKTLASAGKDKTVRVWDAPSGKELRTLSGHTDVVWSVAFSSNGRQLASASKDKTVKIWDTQTWELIRTLTGHTSAVIALAFMPNGGALATGSDDNTIKLWDPFLLTELRTLKGHTSYITSLAFSGDGQILASASNDQTVRLWNPQTGELRQTLTGHTKGVTSVGFSPDGKTIVTGSRDESVKAWQ